MTERDQFEAAMSAWCDPAKGEETFYRDGDGYEAYATLFAWYAWQAARATAEQSRDTERIDALEVMANQPGGVLLHDGTERGRTGLGLRPGSLVRTLREAIDAAIESQRSGEGS